MSISLIKQELELDIMDEKEQKNLKRRYKEERNV